MRAPGGPGRARALAAEASGDRPPRSTRRPTVSRRAPTSWPRRRRSAPRLILIATGSEVALALEAREKLEGEGIPTRVVSMPSWELFERQPREYREEVLPPLGPARLSIEAGASLGWKRYVGDGGDSIGLDRYGASAPGEIVLKELGFNVENVVQTGKGSVCEDRGRLRPRGFRAEGGDRGAARGVGPLRSRTSAPTTAEPVRLSGLRARASRRRSPRERCERGIVVCGSGVGASRRGQQGPGNPGRSCATTRSRRGRVSRTTT